MEAQIFNKTGGLYKSRPGNLSDFKKKLSSSIKDIRILIHIVFRATIQKYFHNFIVKRSYNIEINIS